MLLDAGESIKAVSEYLGHSDPGLTLKVYARPMPGNRDRPRQALGNSVKPCGRTVPREGPQWAQSKRMPPICAVCASQGHDRFWCYFLPWFLTASMAAAAASGSR